MAPVLLQWGVLPSVTVATNSFIAGIAVVTNVLNYLGLGILLVSSLSSVSI